MLSKYYRIKADAADLLLGIGISKNHVRAILGQPCTQVQCVVTGKITQVEFPGRLIGWKEPFVFCVPNNALTRMNDQRNQPALEEFSESVVAKRAGSVSPLQTRSAKEEFRS